jgi:hypothetical protein
MSFSRGTAFAPSHGMWRSRTVPPPGSTSSSRRCTASKRLVSVILGRTPRQVGALKPAEKRHRLVTETHRVDRPLGRDLALALARTGECVDEAVDVTTDPGGTGGHNARGCPRARTPCRGPSYTSPERKISFAMTSRWICDVPS